MMTTCDHSLGILGSMETISISRDWHTRKCVVCKEVERLPRAGKLWVGVSIQGETLKDFDRREYAKDLLQGWNIDGSKNELFEEAYGDPIKKGKAKKGSKIKPVKEKKK